jgi:hypothetical protein
MQRRFSHAQNRYQGKRFQRADAASIRGCSSPVLFSPRLDAIAISSSINSMPIDGKLKTKELPTLKINKLELN